MKKLLFLLAWLLPYVGQAQTHARMMLWDSHERHPLVWQVEFDGADSLLATYDAVYGHGPMIENDTYALRVYAQPWPRIDLYGKSGRYPLELPTTCFYTTPEQRKAGYGADVLLVGPTIGVGSLLGWDGEHTQALEPVERRGQRVVYTSEDSSAVENYVRGWAYQGQRINLVQRLTMRKGQAWTEVDVWLEAADPDALLFATGIQRLREDKGHRTQGGEAETWGSNEPEPGLNVDVKLGFQIEAKYIERQLDAEQSTLYIVRPQRGHIKYRVKAETSLFSM